MTFETKFRNFVGRLKSKEFSHTELVIIADELLREYNNERKVVIEGWHGKSSFDFEEVGDTIIVTKFQKPERGAEPKEIKTKIDLWELRSIRNIILSMYRGKEFLKSKDVAEAFYEMKWDKIFTNRKLHNKFCIILNVLDKKNFIEYRGGRIRLL